MVKNIGKFRNKYWLKNKYLKANLSQGEIASLCNVSGSTIGKYTKKFNLKKSKLVFLYLTKNFNQEKVAEKLGVSTALVRPWLRYYGIEKSVAKQVKSAKDTLFRKYGTRSICKVNTEKKKKTWLKNLGVDNPQKSKTVKEKTLKTCYAKNKGKLFLNTKKGIKQKKKTWLKNLGVDNPSKSKKIAEKKSRSCLKTLGVSFPALSPIVVAKAHETKKKNGSYGKSKDLYIEYQGSWTHGNRPFLGKSVRSARGRQEQELLALWQNKDTKYYKAAINTWTKTDPKKRKTARKNSLNFLEIWGCDFAKGKKRIKFLLQTCRR